jgi:hypothetical protein
MIIPINGLQQRQKEMSEFVAPSQYPTHRLLNQYLWVDFAGVVFTASSLFSFSFIAILFSLIAIRTVCVSFLFIFYK